MADLREGKIVETDVGEFALPIMGRNSRISEAMSRQDQLNNPHVSRFQEKKVLMVTDVYSPYTSGVVRTLTNTIRILNHLGCQVACLNPRGFWLYPMGPADHPKSFWTFPIPFAPNLRMALPNLGRIERMIREFDPDYIHIATEGLLGRALRRVCLQKELKFTTSFHTLMAEHLNKMLGLPTRLGWHYLREFHKGSEKVMAPTPSIIRLLEKLGFEKVVEWPGGVSLEQFHPRERTWPPQERPILLNVGRISVEKNLEAFLDVDVPGTKYIVGEGPQLRELKSRYPQARFLGQLKDEDLAVAYANADLFVFPSRLDTFGNVILEALASGVPVAAFPVPGPLDLIRDERAGVLHENLETAITEALSRCSPDACVQLARRFTWERATEQFFDHLVLKSD